ncbi:MAG: hypothetical protein R2695_14305 [Acidimicrobiales bacterium]
MPEVLSSLLLVTVAANLVGYGLQHEWLLLARSPAAPTASASPNSSRRHPAPDDRAVRQAISAGLRSRSMLAVVVAIRGCTGRWSASGLRTLGANPARRAGPLGGPVRRAALVASGSCRPGRRSCWPAVRSATTGWSTASPRRSDGRTLLVALVAGRRVAAAGVAFVFAGLRTGSKVRCATGVERGGSRR